MAATRNVPGSILGKVKILKERKMEGLPLGTQWHTNENILRSKASQFSRSVPAFNCKVASNCVNQYAHYML